LQTTQPGDVTPPSPKISPIYPPEPYNPLDTSKFPVINENPSLADLALSHKIKNINNFN
jgi:hypothetical protein